MNRRWSDVSLPLCVLLGAGGRSSAQAWVGTLIFALCGQRRLPSRSPPITHRGTSTGLRSPGSHVDFATEEVTPFL